MYIEGNLVFPRFGWNYGYFSALASPLRFRVDYTQGNPFLLALSFIHLGPSVTAPSGELPPKYAKLDRFGIRWKALLGSFEGYLDALLCERASQEVVADLHIV